MKGIIRAYLLFAGLLFLGFTAAEAQSNRLAGKQWSLVEINGKRHANSAAFIEFERDARRFSGNAGCNRMFGGVTIGRSTMRFSGIGTTRMYCDELMSSETDLINALKKVTRYQFRRNKLTMFAGRRAVLRFTGAPLGGNDAPEPQKVRLESRKWMLDAIEGRSVGKLKEVAFINFDAEKKSAGGNTSCNAFGGSYETSNGNGIRIFETFSTMRACIEDERMSVERSFLNGLREADRYVLHGDKLDLYKGGKLLLSFNGTAK